ncbi:MAG: thiamine pyrophosphate-binding protein, partial [Proteobacteria bacterium]|nr:thiamine pyrophosphate-binding protein [Pseudomonadota bacterium]
MATDTRTGGQLVVDALLTNGIDRAYCVPGESYLGVLEAIREAGNSFQLNVCRQEGGAAYMAEAYACLTGKPGVCMVTRGPGACNASIGIHTAEQEGVPMLLLVGHTTTGTEGRVAFQEIDLQGMYGGMAKWVTVVPSADHMADVMARAIRIAMSGRPGPVVIGLPEDIQFDAARAANLAPTTLPRPAPSTSAMSAFSALIGAAERPLLLLGGMKWTEAARHQISEFSSRLGIPVASSFRRQDLMDNDHPCYVGSLGVGPDPALVRYVDDSDLLILIGGQIGEIETGRFQRLTEATSGRKVVHVAPDGEMLGRVLTPDLAITADPAEFCLALDGVSTDSVGKWKIHLAELRASYETYRKPLEFSGHENPGHAVAALSDVLPPDTVITLGAGNYTHFVLRHHKFREPNTLLGPINAPMGSSVPAAIAAAQQYPDREVIAYAGDGCFLMNAQELVMAAKQNLRLAVIIFNNGIYGSIRMHQELHYPGQPVATDLDNPDFVAFAESMNIPAVRIDSVHDLTGAYRDLRDRHAGPILIEMMTDPEVSPPQATIGQL